MLRRSLDSCKLLGGTHNISTSGPTRPFVRSSNFVAVATLIDDAVLDSLTSTDSAHVFLDGSTVRGTGLSGQSFVDFFQGLMADRGV